MGGGGGVLEPLYLIIIQVSLTQSFSCHRWKEMWLPMCYSPLPNALHASGPASAHHDAIHPADDSAPHAPWPTRTLRTAPSAVPTALPHPQLRPQDCAPPNAPWPPSPTNATSTPLHDTANAAHLRPPPAPSSLPTPTPGASAPTTPLPHRADCAPARPPLPATTPSSLLPTQLPAHVFDCLCPRLPCEMLQERKGGDEGRQSRAERREEGRQEGTQEGEEGLDLTSGTHDWNFSQRSLTFQCHAQNHLFGSQFKFLSLGSGVGTAIFMFP